FDAPFNNIFELNDAEHFPAFGNDQWSATITGNFVYANADFVWKYAALLIDINANSFRSALPNGPFDPVLSDQRTSIRRWSRQGSIKKVYATHAGLSRKWNKFGLPVGDITRAQIKLLFGQNSNASTFGCFVGQ